MAVGAKGVLGFAKEVTWGTGLAPTTYIPFSSESFKDGPEFMSEAQIRGILDSDPQYKGMEVVSGAFSGVAYPNILGALLRAALGAPVTSGAGPYTHVYTPVQAAFSADAALPPYSFTVNRDGVQVNRYEGMVCNKFGLKFTQGGLLTYDTGWIGRDVTYQSAPTVALPGDVPFQLTAAVQRNATAYAELQDFSIDITNSIEGVKLINNSDKIGRIVWSGKRTISLSLTADFANQLLYDDFKLGTVKPWLFVFTQGASILSIAIPAVLIKDAAANVGGDGRITMSASGDAQYDVGSSRAIQISLTNTSPTY